MNSYATAPKPPSLHWAIVLVLSFVTFGLFGFFWMFRQARFARKIDPTNLAAVQVLASIALFLFSLLLNTIVALTIARGGEATNIGAAGSVMDFFQIFLVISAYLQIRKALTKHYGMQLNTLWTLLFNVFYVQYHLSQIARTRGVRLAHTVLPPSQAGPASA